MLCILFALATHLCFTLFTISLSLPPPSVPLFRAIPIDQRNRILAVIQADPVVRTIHNVKAVSIGSQHLRFQAELDFNGDEIARRYNIVTTL